MSLSGNVLMSAAIEVVHAGVRLLEKNLEQQTIIIDSSSRRREEKSSKFSMGSGSCSSGTARS